jgi:hypothetical protein
MRIQEHCDNPGPSRNTGRPRSRVKWPADSVNSNQPIAAVSKPPRKPAKISHAARTAAILSARTHKIREIASLRRANLDSASFAAKAQTLLTRDWSQASWRARESILRSVAWLLRLEKAARSHVSVTRPPSCS